MRNSATKVPKGTAPDDLCPQMSVLSMQNTTNTMPG